MAAFYPRVPHCSGDSFVLSGKDRMVSRAQRGHLKGTELRAGGTEAGGRQWWRQHISRAGVATALEVP